MPAGSRAAVDPAMDAMWHSGAMEELSITCPRCGTAVVVSFYGPCAACREQLRETLGGDASAVADVEYEPKMNVTPNAVALKDD